jgi:hypothetical protein
MSIPMRGHVVSSGLVQATAALSLLLAACGSSNPPETGLGSTDAQVQDGKTRFTVITPTLIRLEYAEDGHFEDRPTHTVAERPLPTTAFERRVENGELVIQTDALSLRYRCSGHVARDRGGRRRRGLSLIN